MAHKYILDIIIFHIKWKVLAFFWVVKQCEPGSMDRTFCNLEVTQEKAYFLIHVPFTSCWDTLRRPSLLSFLQCSIFFLFMFTFWLKRGNRAILNFSLINPIIQILQFSACLAFEPNSTPPCLDCNHPNNHLMEARLLLNKQERIRIDLESMTDDRSLSISLF